MTAKKLAIRTRAQALAFIRKVKICGIFSDDKGRMNCLWDVVDLPGRQPGEKGWGKKVIAIWQWKDELPAIYPDEIFYGKLPNGLAVLMTMDYLRGTHYSAHHVPVIECSPLAQRIHELVGFDPLTTPQLRKELDMQKRPARTRFDKALKELQATLNIARRNSLADENDTWVPFREQYSL